MRTIRPFHLAIPVDDLAKARHFYATVLGCAEGRSSAEWIDFNLFGHQLVVHQVPRVPKTTANPVDGHQVPVPHFGVVLDWTEFHAFAARIKALGVAFVIEPYVRFEGQVGEQATMFFRDPADNALEFKSFRDPGQLFAK
ncbi:MAG: VOC family protein [Pseudomonadota bacterium]|nr:VOC family protein [Pseudomonadota bacterium]